MVDFAQLSTTYENCESAVDDEGIVSPMHVVVVSGDGELYKLCREILNDCKDLDWRVLKATPECLPPADFYVWDEPDANDLPNGIDLRPSKHLFLVSRSDITK